MAEEVRTARPDILFVAMSSPLLASTHRRQCTCVSGGAPRALPDSVFRRRWFDSYPIVAVMTLLRVDSSALRAWNSGGMRGPEPERLAWFRVDRRWTSFGDDSLPMVWSDVPPLSLRR